MNTLTIQDRILSITHIIMFRILTEDCFAKARQLHNYLSVITRDKDKT